jgi:vacuolar protein sorting-associated protein 13A/C
LTSLLTRTFYSHKDQANFDTLECKLSYEDIQFYRSIGRSQLQKERADQKKLQAEQAKKAPPQKQGWVSWALGYSPPNASQDEEPGRDGMTDKQRQEPYAAIGYDESNEVAASLVPSRDIMKARIYAQLGTGSLSLCRGPAADDVISAIFDDFNATSSSILATLMPLSPSAGCAFSSSLLTLTSPFRMLFWTRH